MHAGRLKTISWFVVPAKAGTHASAGTALASQARRWRRGSPLSRGRHGRSEIDLPEIINRQRHADGDDEPAELHRIEALGTARAEIAAGEGAGHHHQCL